MSLLVQLAQAPITKKDTESGGGNGIAFAVSQMQGWRSSMEDAHTAAAEILGLPGCSFFAVFDGHAGSYMSRIWCALGRFSIVQVLLNRFRPPARSSTAVLKRVVETLGPKSGSEPVRLPGLSS